MTCDMLILVLTVLTMELSIWLNGIRDVNSLGSSGQLILFIVGLGSCVSALTQFYRGRRAKKQSRTPVEERRPAQAELLDREATKQELLARALLVCECQICSIVAKSNDMPVSWKPNGMVVDTLPIEWQAGYRVSPSPGPQNSPSRSRKTQF